MDDKRKIILASGSDRRARILADCGVRFSVITSGVEEVDTGGHISDIVLANAVRKAESVAEGRSHCIVVGADTLVAHGEDVLGKPGSEVAAKEMLARFSGTDVEVYTGLCVIDVESKKKTSSVERSEITVARLDAGEVERYFRLLGPYDKAGGFSIEGVGSMLFDDVRGSYFNILGLSMMKLRVMFGEIGLDILDHIY